MRRDDQGPNGLKASPSDEKSTVFPFGEHGILLGVRELSERTHPQPEDEAGQRVLEELQQLLDFGLGA